MAADTKALRNRIKSVNSTLHLTKAMGLVASSKIRRANDAFFKAAEYKKAFGEVIGQLSLSPECQKSPFMLLKGERAALIVIAGDRGLAGGYNANIFRAFSELRADYIIPIGKRACERYKGELRLCESFSSEDANALAKRLCDGFISGEFDRVGILSSRYISVMECEPKIEYVLPIAPHDRENSGSSIVFEPDEKSVLEKAVPDYVAGAIVAAVKESYACEVAARRMAMDSAGKNAQEMIDELTLSYNQARQGAITQEITEIVAGGGEY